MPKTKEIIYTIILCCVIYLSKLSINSNSDLFRKPEKSVWSMATTGAASQSFILWLHGLGESGPAYEPIKDFFTAPQFNNTKWSFPTAPESPVTCVDGAVMPSWFDVPELPITANSQINESQVLLAVEKIHAMIDQEIEAGTEPDNVFVCGFSQGAALTAASVLLYPKTLGGGAIFSGFIPFDFSIANRFPLEAKKTPLLLLHGTTDPVVLLEAAQKALTLFEQLGINYELKAYPDIGHSLSEEEFRYLESWIKPRLHSSP